MAKTINNTDEWSKFNASADIKQHRRGVGKKHYTAVIASLAVLAVGGTFLIGGTYNYVASKVMWAVTAVGKTMQGKKPNVHKKAPIINFSPEEALIARRTAEAKKNGTIYVPDTPDKDPVDQAFAKYDKEIARTHTAEHRFNITSDVTKYAALCWTIYDHGGSKIKTGYMPMSAADPRYDFKTCIVKLNELGKLADNPKYQVRLEVKPAGANKTPQSLDWFAFEIREPRELEKLPSSYKNAFCAQAQPVIERATGNVYAPPLINGGKTATPREVTISAIEWIYNNPSEQNADNLGEKAIKFAYDDLIARAKSGGAVIGTVDTKTLTKTDTYWSGYSVTDLPNVKFNTNAPNVFKVVSSALTL